MYVFRIQHPIDNWGPFNSRGPYGKNEQFQEFKKAICHYYGQSLPVLADIKPGEFCGCSSIKQLIKIFNVEFNRHIIDEFNLEITNVWEALDYFGFIIVKWNAPDWRLSIVDKQQIIFDPKTAHRAFTWRMDEQAAQENVR